MKNYSNYHNTNYTDKLLRDGVKTFERSLTTSPDSSMVSVNNVNKRIMIQSTSKYDERRILFKHGDINWGDVVLHEDEKWLVTERPYFNKIHDKSKMQLCNNTLVLYGEPQKVYKGDDELGRPIWEYKQAPKYEYPCVVTRVNNLDASGDEPINLINDNMAILISYPSYPAIKYGQEFQMNNNSYRIEGMDYRKVIDNQGVLVLVVDKIT